MISAFVARAQWRLKLRYGHMHPGGKRMWIGLLTRLCRAVWIEHQEA